MISKLAYAIYEDRIKEEARLGLPLGSAESDWRRAEQIIEFCNSPVKNTWQYGNFLDDHMKHIAVYERLKTC